MLQNSSMPTLMTCQYWWCTVDHANVGDIQFDQSGQHGWCHSWWHHYKATEHMLLWSYKAYVTMKLQSICCYEAMKHTLLQNYKAHVYSSCIINYLFDQISMLFYCECFSCNWLSALWDYWFQAYIFSLYCLQIFSHAIFFMLWDLELFC